VAGVLVTLPGPDVSLLTLDVENGRILMVYIVRNPEKLGGVPGP
jgi:hypothetical protein